MYSPLLNALEEQIEEEEEAAAAVEQKNKT